MIRANSSPPGVPLESRHGARRSQHQTQQCEAAFRTRLRPTALASSNFPIAIVCATIHIPSVWMVDEGRAMIGEIHRLRDKPPGENEKITINVGFVDLGHIDLLVHEGFYSNRTDFIRTAIRNQLATHADAVKQSIVRHTRD